MAYAEKQNARAKVLNNLILNNSTKIKICWEILSRQKFIRLIIFLDCGNFKKQVRH